MFIKTDSVKQIFDKVYDWPEAVKFKSNFHECVEGDTNS